MSPSKFEKTRTVKLRKKAEAGLVRLPIPQEPIRSVDELLHELNVRKIEMEMQNEELRRTHQSREHYADLYEFAPIGYLTLSNEGLIHEINLAGAMLLGDERNKIPGKSFDGYVAPEYRDHWRSHLLDALKKGESYSDKFLLLRSDSSNIYVRFEAQYRPIGGADTLCIALTDITEHKQLEQQCQLKEFALNHAHEAVYVINAGQHFVYVNAEACRALGYSSEELLCLTVPDIDACYSPAELISITDKSQAEHTIRHETLYLRRDGSTFPVEIQSSAFEYQGLTMGVALARDISERKATEKALRASEERMRLFFERQLVGMAITSPEKGWLQVNDKVCDILGYSFDELKKLSWADVTHPDDLALDKAQFDRMLKGEIDSYTVEKRYLRKDGGIVYAALSIGCVRKADGAVDYALVLIEDVTERKHNEMELKAAKRLLKMKNTHLQANKAELEQCVTARTSELSTTNQLLREEIDERKQAEERLSVMAANVPGFIFTIRVEANGNTSFPFASSGVEDLFGVSPADIRRDAGALRARYHPDDLPRLLDLMAETERTLGLFHIEIRIANRDNRYLWVEIRSRPKRLPEGGTEWHGIMFDISARKQAESDLEKLHIQLRGLLARSDNTREDERKRIAREVHDELGQILTGLQLSVSHLARQCAIGVPPLREQAEETIMLTNQAVSIARNIATALRPVELDSGIVAALQLQAKRFSLVTGIQCTCTFEDNEILLNENSATALYRIFQEVLTNVVKHAKARRVDISLTKDAGYYILKMCDNGIGFDTRNQKENSFGLLGIRERVLMLGGTMNIDSRKGEGTKIIVRFPEGHNSD